MTEAPKPTTLYHWSPYLLLKGCRISGSLEDRDDTDVKRLFSSRVVKREGMVIETASGTPYLLDKPHELCSTAGKRLECHRMLGLGRSHTIEEYIDACIAYESSVLKTKKKK